MPVAPPRWDTAHPGDADLAPSFYTPKVAQSPMEQAQAAPLCIAFGTQVVLHLLQALLQWRTNAQRHAGGQHINDEQVQ